MIGIWLQIADDSIERADEYIANLQAICELISEQPAMGVDETRNRYHLIFDGFQDHLGIPAASQRLVQIHQRK